jgi:hypothetical protein
LFTGLYRDLRDMPYFVVLLLVPLVWMVHHTLRAMPRELAWLPAAIVLISSATIAAPAWRAAQRLTAPTPLQACLEAEGRTAGFGDYWTAKELMFRSNRRIHIIQINGRGEPYRWIINERWFTQRADDGTTPRPDFILPGRPKRYDAERLREVFGTPNRVLTCGRGEACGSVAGAQCGGELWLYDHPLPLPH